MESLPLTDEDVDSKYRYVEEDLDGSGRGGFRRLRPFDRNLRRSSIEMFFRISILDEKDDDRMDQGRSIPSVAHENPTVWERKKLLGLVVREFKGEFP